MIYLPSYKRNFMIVSSNNEPFFLLFSSRSEVPYHLFLWPHTQRRIFPCVNSLCEWSAALVRGLLSSTLSHAQVCTTIVDRISSGLPVFPYHQHFSIQSSFNWEADIAHKACCKITASYFDFHVLSKLYYILTFMSFIRKASFAAQLKASCLKGSTCKLTRNWVAPANISPVRLLRLIIAVLTESTTPDWGWHMTFLMAIQYSVTLTVQTRPLCCPSTQTQARPLLCCHCTKLGLLKHSSHAPMTPG